MKKLLFLPFIFLVACGSYTVAPENQDPFVSEPQAKRQAEMIYAAGGEYVYKVTDEAEGRVCYIYDGIQAGGIYCF